MDNREILDQLVLELLEKETLLKNEIESIFAQVKMVSPRPAWTGSPNRTPSTLPPVGLSPANSIAKAAELAAEAAKPARKPRKKAAPASE